MYQPWSYKNLLMAIISLVAGAVAGTIAVLVFTHSPPLTTHRLAVPMNSAVTTVPVPLRGISELPKLLSRDNARQQWAIVGGALLQIGFSRLSIPALERAIASDVDNRMLHVALGGLRANTPVLAAIRNQGFNGIVHSSPLTAECSIDSSLR